MMNLRKDYDPRKPYKEQTSECKYSRPEDISQTTQSSGQILKQHTQQITRNQET